MASLTDELLGLKKKYSQLLTKDEALDLALQAADLHMKFLKIAKDGPEKRDIRRRCSSLLDEAEKIKSSDVWQSDSDSLISFEVLEPTRSGAFPVQPPGSPEPSSQHKFVEPAISGIGIHHQGHHSVMSTSPSGLRSVTSSSNQHQYGHQVQPSSAAAIRTTTRALSKKEQILLWQGSELHGCRFPPWEALPSDADFDRLQGEPLFVCVDEDLMSRDLCAKV